MNLLEKIKNIFWQVGIFIISIPAKTSKSVSRNIPTNIPMQSDYGVPQPDPNPIPYSKLISNFMKLIYPILILSLPIVFIIGCAVYLKKSKLPMKVKLTRLIIILLLLAALLFILLMF